MQAAKAKLEMHPTEEAKARRDNTLEYLAYSLYQQGNAKRALALANELSALNPAHPGVVDIIEL